jgi:thiol:disulfide interchange protein DsbD
MSELLGYSILAFGAGLLLNFVPCVLPVIPVKIHTVLREIKGDIRSRILAAVSLLAGTMSFFLILGSATAYLELAWGDLFRSKLFLAGLTAFFLFAGIATFANWGVRLPHLIYRVPIYRYSGAFFTGALAGILSTPCSGPFLGSVLAYSLTQSPGIIILIFIWIGLGLAMPYIVFLLWPGLMKRLSFSGAWTIWVKQLLGFVLIAGAVFFGRVFLQEVFHPMLWSLFGIMIAIWAVFAFKRSAGWWGRIFSLGTVMTVLFLVILTVSAKQLKWQEFTLESLHNSLAARQPVLIEFTAKWCLNCEILKKTTYEDKSVVRAASKAKLISLRVDMTDFNESHRLLLGKYGGTALPFAVLISSDGKVAQRFQGIFSAKTLETTINLLR